MSDVKGMCNLQRIQDMYGGLSNRSSDKGLGGIWTLIRILEMHMLDKLTGSMRMVPEGPGAPSAPGKPGRPGDP